MTPNSFGQQMPVPGWTPSPDLSANRQAMMAGSMPRRGIGGSVIMQARPRNPMDGTMTRGQAMAQMPSGRMIQPQSVQNRSEIMGGAGVRPGVNMMGRPSVGAPQGPSLEQIQAEMARRNVGAQLGPRNGALAGYMMGR